MDIATIWQEGINTIDFTKYILDHEDIEFSHFLYLPYVCEGMNNEKLVSLTYGYVVLRVIPCRGIFLRVLACTPCIWEKTVFSNFFPSLRSFIFCWRQKFEPKEDTRNPVPCLGVEWPLFHFVGHRPYYSPSFHYTRSPITHKWAYKLCDCECVCRHGGHFAILVQEVLLPRQQVDLVRGEFGDGITQWLF